MNGLTIAVCTRDRQQDLERCLRSVVNAEPPGDLPVHILIVDDGGLPAACVRELGRVVTERGYRFGHVRPETPGLFNGRVTAVAGTATDVILFLDDDVEIEPHYLRHLATAYREHPEAAGVGGVDTLATRPSLPKRLFNRVFLLDSGAPGELSPSGYSESMTRWRSQDEPFRSTFLSGCNMSFRLAALRRLAPVAWLQGYSLGEDVYLSSLARVAGPLWVDPALRVRHHRSAASRLVAPALGYARVANPYHLLRGRRASWPAYVALAWSTAGLLLKDLARPAAWPGLPGYFAGLGHVLRDLSNARRGEHIDLPGLL